MKKMHYSLVLLALTVASPLGAADNYFYTDGKKHPLTPAADWIGVAEGAPVKAAAVKQRVADSGVLRATVPSVTHDQKGITVLPVKAGMTGKATAGIAAAGQRTVRVFQNGSADPIVETDDLIVRFKPEVKRPQAEAMLAARGAVIVRAMGDFAPNAFLARVTNGDPSTDVANRLHETAGVVWAHPDLIWPMVPRYVPNDAMYAQQWHLNNPGGSGGTAGADIKAERAWEFTTGSPDIIIAIVDDGVETTHEDFAGRIVAGWDFVGNDNDPRPGAGQNHGTACAGLAAAAGNNLIGVSGVAPLCRIMPIRLLGPNNTFSNQAAAITWAKNNGAHVISNSWGPADGRGSTDPCPDVVSTAITDASETGRGGKGCLITWAAGNGNESADLDGYASHPRVLCIGATLRNDTRSPYSDFGTAVDLCAPGGSQAGDMVTVDRMGAAGYNPTANYTTGFNGTSAATPVVSGAIALLLSAEPELTRDEVNLRMIAGADFIDTANATYDANGHNNNYGYGRVNIWRTLGWKDNSPPAVSFFNITENEVFTAFATATGGVTESGSGLYKVRGAVRNRTTSKWWKHSVGAWVDGEADSRQVYSSPAWGFQLPPGEGSFELRVQAEDKAGNFSAVASVNYIVDNSSPDLTIAQPGSGTLNSSPGAVSGSAVDAGTGVKEIRVALRDAAGNRWWNWPGNAWGSAAFGWAENATIATGTISWSRALPVLNEGGYEVYVQALDNTNAASEWKSRSFVFDSANPVITFGSLVEQNPVFDFLVTGGTVSEPGTVTWRLTETNPGGTDRYWTGNEWTPNSADPHLWRPSGITGNTWYAAGIVPGRLTSRYGPYLCEARVVDRGGNTAETSIVLIRTATDTTEPVIAFTSPSAGTVITTTSLPPVTGTAADPQSGLTAVNMYMMRAIPGGFSYWGGRGWTLTPTELPLSWNSADGTWQAPLSTGINAWSLPAGPDMINGAWQLQVTATNGELPAGTRLASLAFTVDYHPVYTWTAGSLSDSDPNNNDTFWGNPDNWSPYGIPGAGDIVIIGSGTVQSAVNRTVYGLRMGSGTLNFTHGPGPNGKLTTTNTSAWTGGTMTGIWENQGVITVSGAPVKMLWDHAVLNNYGTVVWEGGGTIRANATGGTVTINNKSGGTFRIAADGSVFDRASVNYRPVFNNGNGALLEKQSGGGVSTLTIWEFHNAGEIRCGAGTLAFVDGGFDNYDLFLDPGTTLTGAGTLRINNATQLNTAVQALCPVELMDASQLAAPAAADVARFEGTLHWWGGVIVGNLTIGPAGVVNLRDAVAGTPVPKVLWDNTTLNNEGTITWLGGGTLQARATGGTATVNNRTGAQFHAAADGTVFSRASVNYTPVFNNEAGAVFRKTAGSGTTLVNTFNFNHRGGMVCDTGLLAFNTVLDIASATAWTGAGDYEMQGGTTTVTGTMALNGPALTILAGDVCGAPDGTGAFATAGGSTVEWKGGTFVRTLKLTAGSAMNLSGPDVKVISDNSVLDNDGTLTWQGGGPLRARATGGIATVNNRAGAQFHAAADGTVFDRASVNYTPVFNNAAGAKFRRTTGTGTATVHTYTFNNQGEVIVDTGVLAFNTTLNLQEGGALSGTGQFVMPGGTVNVTGTTSLTGSRFTVQAGGIAGLAGAVWTTATGGEWHWLGGTLSGTLELGTNSTLKIGDPPAGATVKALADGAVLNNKGLIAWSGAGPLRGHATGGICTVNNRSGAQFQVTADGPLFTRNSVNYVPVFNNDSGGVFVKPTGDAGTASTCDWRFNNAGTVQIGGGKFEMLQGGDSSGSFGANGAAFLRFTGGSHILRSGTILTGTGRIQVAGGTVLGDGVLHGNTTLPGAFDLLTGTLGGTTNYSGAGLFHWAGGTVAGVLNLAAGTRAELDSAAPKLLWDNAAVNNYGTVVWQGDGTIRANATGGTATINNKSGGTFRIAADGSVFDRASVNYRPVFNNENGALLEKQNSFGFSTLTIWEFHNAGEIRCGAGTLAFVDSWSDNYDLFLDPGTTLTGAGTLRINNATQLNTAVQALCLVEMLDASQLAAPAAANVARFEGTLHWWGGAIVGNLTIGPAGVVNLSDVVAGTPVPKVLWDNAVLNNEGTINWLGGGTLQARATGGTATVNNRTGAQFHAAADGTVFDRASVNYTPVFNNEAGAVFRKTAGSSTTLVNTFNFNHRGGMVCDTGLLAFNTVLDIASATAWTGAGDYEMQGGTTTVTGTMALNGPAFTILAGGVWGAPDGTGAFATAGGSTVEWKGGTFVRTLKLTAGSAMNLSGPDVKVLSDNSVLDNDGTLTWHGGGPLRAWATGGIATVNNRTGAQFHAAADGTVFDRASVNYTPMFNNAGTFGIGASPGYCAMSGWTFTQSATGALHIEAAGPAPAEFDRLTLTGGGITLGGALNVTTPDGYAPAVGTTFAFLSSPGRTGNFSIVNAPGFEVDYTPGGATLRAVAAGLPFDAWSASHGLTGANALPGADPDGDGQTNFFEYVHNTSPTAGGGAPQESGIATIGGTPWLTLKYRRWLDREAAGVSYTPQGGSGLMGWGTSGIIDELDPNATVIPGSIACRCRVPIGGTVKFLRVMAVKP